VLVLSLQFSVQLRSCGLTVPRGRVCWASVSTLAPFGQLAKLQELYARKNSVASLAELRHLARCRHLRSLWLVDNPCCAGLDKEEYRLRVLRALPQLETLDNCEVTTHERLLTSAGDGELEAYLKTRKMASLSSPMASATPLRSPERRHMQQLHAPAPRAVPRGTTWVRGPQMSHAVSSDELIHRANGDTRQVLRGVEFDSEMPSHARNSPIPPSLPCCVHPQSSVLDAPPAVKQPQPGGAPAGGAAGVPTYTSPRVNALYAVLALLPTLGREELSAVERDVHARLSALQAA
jgi:hypothetical protein